MAKKGEAVIKVGLVCSVCGRRNYITHKNKINMENKKILLNKYCRQCRRHTPHKENEKLK